MMRRTNVRLDDDHNDDDDDVVVVVVVPVARVRKDVDDDDDDDDEDTTSQASSIDVAAHTSKKKAGSRSPLQSSSSSSSLESNNNNNHKTLALVDVSLKDAKALCSHWKQVAATAAVKGPRTSSLGLETLMLIREEETYNSDSTWPMLFKGLLLLQGSGASSTVRELILSDQHDMPLAVARSARQFLQATTTLRILRVEMDANVDLGGGGGESFSRWKSWRKNRSSLSQILLGMAQNKSVETLTVSSGSGGALMTSSSPTTQTPMLTMLQQNRQLKHLEWTLDSTSLPSFSQALEASSMRLTTLGLTLTGGGNHLTDVNTKDAFLRALKAQNKLNKLRLFFRARDSHTLASAIAGYLGEETCGIQDLELGGDTDWIDGFFASLSRGLKTNSKLTTLTLSLRGVLTTEAIESFIQALRSHTSLAKLKISTVAPNAEVLAKALIQHVGEASSSLTDLEVCGSTQWCKGWLYLQTLVPELYKSLSSTRLERLVLRELVPTPSTASRSDVIRTLCQAFDQNTRLTSTEIGFRSCQVDPVSIKAASWIMSCVPRRNRCIHCLQSSSTTTKKVAPALWPYMLQILLSTPSCALADDNNKKAAATEKRTNNDVALTAVYKTLLHQSLAPDLLLLPSC